MVFTAILVCRTLSWILSEAPKLFHRMISHQPDLYGGIWVISAHSPLNSTNDNALLVYPFTNLFHLFYRDGMMQVQKYRCITSKCITVQQLFEKTMSKFRMLLYYWYQSFSYIIFDRFYFKKNIYAFTHMHWKLFVCFQKQLACLENGERQVAIFSPVVVLYFILKP